MEIYLICNNLYENNLSYLDKGNLDSKKMTRPLSVEGEALAKEISINDEFIGTTLIYSSISSSCLATAKYLAERVEKNIIVDENLNDALIGELGTRKLKTIKFMQEHDLNIKLTDGESLNDVGTRALNVINRVLYLNCNKKAVLFTHRRTMLGLLLKLGNPGYNLDDDLIVEFNDKVIYNNEDKDFNIIKITIENKKVVDINEII